jgi:Glutaredoxin-like domain (DUF836)
MARKAQNRIVVYGKPGCHLCDIAYELALGLCADYDLSVQKIDITCDAALTQKYREIIPVLVVNAHTTLTPPIRLAEVRRALGTHESSLEAE